MDAFVADFSAYRLDEVLGPWKPYKDVVANALTRTCKANGVAYRDSDADAVYAAVPTWGPHPDVVEGWPRSPRNSPGDPVELDEGADPHSVAKLGAPFHAAYTAEEAQAYKPRMQAFEYMFDQLGCGPEDVLHCSSSFRYDLMTAHDLRITNKVFVNRGQEPANPYYGYHEIKDIRGLPGLLGL